MLAEIEDRMAINQGMQELIESRITTVLNKIKNEQMLAGSMQEHSALYAEARALGLTNEGRAAEAIGKAQVEKAQIGQLQTQAKRELAEQQRIIDDIKSGYTEAQVDLKDQLLRAKDTLREEEVLKPGLKRLMRFSSPNEAAAEIFKDANNDIVSDYVEFHLTRPGGQQNIDTLRKALVEKWMFDMFDKDLGTITAKSFDNLSQPGRGLTRQSLGILYQDREAADRVFDTLEKIAKYQKGFFGGNKFVRRGIQHWVHTLPYAMMLHPGALLSPGMVALTTVGGISVAWPKLIDRIVKDPKMYAQFAQWLDSGATMQATLAAPHVARLFWEEGDRHHVLDSSNKLRQPTDLPAEDIERINQLLSGAQ
jgi:hypothetical protein